MKTTEDRLVTRRGVVKMLGLGSAALATGVLGNVSGARGQAAGNAAGAVKKPANFGLVSVYEVDPAFPKKPDNITWSGGMPGVDVDAKDRVWIINRALPLVAEFEADGKFI
jgi:hypothetical protein